MWSKNGIIQLEGSTSVTRSSHACTLEIHSGPLGLNIYEGIEQEATYPVRFRHFTGTSNAKQQANGKLHNGMSLTHVNGADLEGLSYNEVVSGLGVRPCKLRFSQNNSERKESERKESERKESERKESERKESEYEYEKINLSRKTTAETRSPILITGGLEPVTLKHRVITKSVNINSMFRDTIAPPLWSANKKYNSYNGSSTGTSSNFSIRLPTPLDKVTSMVLSSIELPHTFYTFSSELKTNVFRIWLIKDGKKTPHIIEIMSGNYLRVELIKQIQATIHLILPKSRIFINVHHSYGKCYIFSSDPQIKFDLDFRIPDDLTRDIRLNMGWLLGFRAPYYQYEQCHETSSLEIGQYVRWWTDIDTSFNTDCSGDYPWAASHKNLDKQHFNVIRNEQISFVKSNYDVSMVLPMDRYTVGDVYIPHKGLYDLSGSDDEMPSSYPIYPFGFISEGDVNCHGSMYIFLLVNDFNNRSNDHYTSLVFNNTLIPCSDILARIAIRAGTGSMLFDNVADFVPKKREYNGNVSIDKLHFKLVDEFGRNINLNNNDISLLLSFEVISNL